MAAERSPFIEFPPKTDVNPDIGLAVCLRRASECRPQRSVAWSGQVRLGIRGPPGIRGLVYALVGVADQVPVLGPARWGWAIWDRLVISNE